MMRIPAHKNIENPPGQIVNRPDVTLGDYIARKQDTDIAPTTKIYLVKYDIDFECHGVSSAHRTKEGAFKKAAADEFSYVEEFYLEE
jgi:hypothetical protein